MTEVGDRSPKRLAGLAGDAVLAAAAGVIVILTTVLSWGPGITVITMPIMGWLFIVVASAALAFRRRYPIVVAVITLVVTVLHYLLDDPDGAMIITFIIALYTLASEGLLLVAGAVSVVALVATTYGEYGTGESPIGTPAFVLLVGWFVAAVAVGAVARNRRDYLREVQERARDAERNREESLQRKAIEERLRIARELHDVLGHNISMINVQAGAALHGAERDPALAADALAAIKESSREALQELRNTLGVLRQVDTEAPTSPPPGLNRLGALTRRCEAAGIEAEVIISGEERELPAAIDLAAYRIIQEALTNVIRHADARHVAVRVGYTDHDVSVDVEDDGRGGPAETGSGIHGMAERARAIGGALDVGERPEGGFRVSARLPYGEDR